MAIPAFPLSYELDFNGDGVWDTEWELSRGETVTVEIWVDDYFEELFFAGLLYFQYDPVKIRINEASSYPNDSNHGGPFTPALSYIKQSVDDNVYEMSLAEFNFVTVFDNKILLFTIELECIDDGTDIAIKAGNDLGFGEYNDGFVIDGNEIKGYPGDAIADYDSDSDGVGDFFSDNCPYHYNPYQVDFNGNGIGDVCEDDKGDVNDNGVLDVGDIQKIINIILGFLSPTDRERWAADCNNDGVINVCDVQIVINKFLFG
jgi:hypothetical protein